MALAKHLPTIFLLVSLFISPYVVDARESQFFSKVTNTNNNNNNNVVNVQETQLANTKQEKQVNNNLNKQESQETQPTFIPNENGYGLYDHGAGQFPPQATKTTTPQDSLYSDPNSNFNNMNKYNEQFNYNNNKYEERYNNNNNNNNNNYNDNYNNNYYNKDSYVTEAEQEQLGGARLQQTDNYATMSGQKNYNTGGNRYSSNNGFKKEGMSDTRFMEDGKYFYDVDNEEKYYPKYNQATYQYQKEGSFRNRNNNVNEYNNYANNMNYNNNDNYNNNYNNNGYYQNNNEEEFQENQNEFEP